jgi:hypothetical protein
LGSIANGRAERAQREVRGIDAWISRSPRKRYASAPPDVATAAREVAAMTPKAIDAELRRAGYDPERVAAAGVAMAARFAKLGPS